MLGIVCHDFLNNLAEKCSEQKLVNIKTITRCNMKGY